MLDDLAKDIVNFQWNLSYLSEDQKGGVRRDLKEYWRERWEAISYRMGKKMDLGIDSTARALVIHHEGLDNVLPDWKSVYRCSKMYVGNNQNAELYANDYARTGQIENGFPASGYVHDKDTTYLMTLKVFADTPAPPSPAINTSNTPVTASTSLRFPQGLHYTR